MGWILAITFLLFALGACAMSRRSERKMQHRATRREWTEQEIRDYVDLMKMGGINKTNNRGY